jgi:hypothetical protein
MSLTSRAFARSVHTVLVASAAVAVALLLSSRAARADDFDFGGGGYDYNDAGYGTSTSYGYEDFSYDPEPMPDPVPADPIPVPDPLPPDPLPAPDPVPSPEPPPPPGPTPTPPEDQIVPDDDIQQDPWGTPSENFLIPNAEPDPPALIEIQNPTTPASLVSGVGAPAVLVPDVTQQLMAASTEPEYVVPTEPPLLIESDPIVEVHPVTLGEPTFTPLEPYTGEEPLWGDPPLWGGEPTTDPEPTTPVEPDPVEPLFGGAGAPAAAFQVDPALIASAAADPAPVVSEPALDPLVPFEAPAGEATPDPSTVAASGIEPSSIISEPSDDPAVTFGGNPTVTVNGSGTISANGMGGSVTTSVNQPVVSWETGPNTGSFGLNGTTTAVSNPTGSWTNSSVGATVGNSTSIVSDPNGTSLDFNASANINASTTDQPVSGSASDLGGSVSVGIDATVPFGNGGGLNFVNNNTFSTDAPPVSTAGALVGTPLGGGFTGIGHGNVTVTDGEVTDYTVGAGVAWTSPGDNFGFGAGVSNDPDGTSVGFGGYGNLGSGWGVNGSVGTGPDGTAVNLGVTSGNFNAGVTWYPNNGNASFGVGVCFPECPSGGSTPSTAWTPGSAAPTWPEPLDADDFDVDPDDDGMFSSTVSPDSLFDPNVSWAATDDPSLTFGAVGGSTTSGDDGSTFVGAFSSTTDPTTLEDPSTTWAASTDPTLNASFTSVTTSTSTATPGSSSSSPTSSSTSSSTGTSSGTTTSSTGSGSAGSSSSSGSSTTTSYSGSSTGTSYSYSDPGASSATSYTGGSSGSFSSSGSGTGAYDPSASYSYGGSSYSSYGTYGMSGLPDFAGPLINTAPLASNWWTHVVDWLVPTLQTTDYFTDILRNGPDFSALNDEASVYGFFGAVSAGAVNTALNGIKYAITQTPLSVVRDLVGMTVIREDLSENPWIDLGLKFGVSEAIVFGTNALGQAIDWGLSKTPIAGWLANNNATFSYAPGVLGIVARGVVPTFVVTSWLKENVLIPVGLLDDPADHFGTYPNLTSYNNALVYDAAAACLALSTFAFLSPSAGLKSCAFGAAQTVGARLVTSEPPGGRLNWLRNATEDMCNVVENPIFSALNCNAKADPLVPPGSGPQLWSTETVGPAIVGPAIVGPKIVGPKIVGPKIVGPKIVGPAIVGPKIVGPKIVGPLIVGEGIVGPGTSPSPTYDGYSGGYGSGYSSPAPTQPQAAPRPPRPATTPNYTDYGPAPKPQSNWWDPIVQWAPAVGAGAAWMIFGNSY